MKDQVLQTNGSGVLSFGTISGSKFGTALLHVRDEKSNGTHGGYASSSFTKVTLNTVKTNEISGASLSSDVITLPSGTYYMVAQVQGNYCEYLQGRLRNTTDGSDTLIGTNVYTTSYGVDVGSMFSIVTGRFTIASQKTFELQRRVSNATYTHGAGLACSFGVGEVYSEAQIWKVA